MKLTKIYSNNQMMLGLDIGYSNMKQNSKHKINMEHLGLRKICLQ